jgi:hypothetical protein
MGDHDRRRVRPGHATLCALATCLALAAVASAGASAARPSTADARVSALAARERAVLAQLTAYPKRGSAAARRSWSARLATLEAAQTKAEALLAGLAAPAPAKTPSVVVAHLGAALPFRDDKGDAYSVALVRVIDPAKGADQYTTANPGERFVAAVFTIANAGSASTTDDANTNATVLGSNAVSYSADFDPVAECTNFNGGTYQLGRGQSLTGCVVFQLPAGVKVARVQWSPNGGVGNASPGAWKAG